MYNIWILRHWSYNEQWDITPKAKDGIHRLATMMKWAHNHIPRSISVYRNTEKKRVKQTADELYQALQQGWLSVTINKLNESFFSEDDIVSLPEYNKNRLFIVVCDEAWPQWNLWVTINKWQIHFFTHDWGLLTYWESIEIEALS